MKPYSFDRDHSNTTGCCPGHDWPRCRRFAGSYKNSAKTDAKMNNIAKRERRRRDKHALRAELARMEER